MSYFRRSIIIGIAQAHSIVIVKTMDEMDEKAIEGYGTVKMSIFYAITDKRAYSSVNVK